jgi:hypothetical protein
MSGNSCQGVRIRLTPRERMSSALAYPSVLEKTPGLSMVFQTSGKSRHESRRPLRANWPLWIRFAGLLTMLTFTILNHGCHGNDVDDELAVSQMPRAEGQSTRPPVGPSHAHSTQPGPLEPGSPVKSAALPSAADWQTGRSDRP